MYQVFKNVNHPCNISAIKLKMTFSNTNILSTSSQLSFNLYIVCAVFNNSTVNLF